MFIHMLREVIPLALQTIKQLLKELQVAEKKSTEASQALSKAEKAYKHLGRRRRVSESELAARLQNYKVAKEHWDECYRAEREIEARLEEAENTILPS